jgi:asparagine synthase (glutamine-hydrolysing)
VTPTNGQPGFTVVSRNQTADLALENESGPDRFPLLTTAEADGCTCLLLGRLYYRAALFARVAGQLATEGPCETVSDAALALAAYRQHGCEGIPLLEGDFALVIWDSRSRELIGARDPLGGYPLYWIQTGETIALSTSLRSLVSLLPRLRLNMDYLADYLMLPGCAREELPGERCAYEDVRRVLPGSIIRADLSTGNVQTKRYWDWLERIAEPESDRPEEIARQYGELLRQSVRERVRGCAAAHLSGGMDSTAVALLASEHLQAAGEGPLHAVSLTFKRMSRLAGENEFIGAVLEQHRELVPHRVVGDDCIAFSDPPPHDEPWPSAFWMEPERLLSRAAVAAGATTLLTGFGADEMVDREPFHIADLLRGGRFVRAWGEASRWAQSFACSRWSVFYPFGLQNLLPAWARMGLGPLLHKGYASGERQNGYTIGRWILPGFARRYDLFGRAIDHVRRMYSSCRPTSLSLALSGIASRSGDLSRWYLGAPQGLHRAHPFLDPRLLCFCLGLHARLEPTPGRTKPVLADAMHSVLPPKIRERRKGGDFNEFCFRSLARSLPALERLVEEAPVDDLELVDKRALTESLRRTSLGTGKDIGSLGRLFLTLSLLQWLSQEAVPCPPHAKALAQSPRPDSTNAAQ